MRLLPYERLTLHSEDPPDVVQAKLATLVTTKWFHLKRPPQPFRGSVQGRHFKVVRVLGSSLGRRNSWQPVIIGDIAPVTSGTEIRVRMRLQVFVGAFTAFWFGGVLWGASMLGRTAGAGVRLMVVGMMMLPAYVLVGVSFWSEVKKARAALCEGLGCRVAEQANRLVR